MALGLEAIPGLSSVASVGRAIEPFLNRVSQGGNKIGGATWLADAGLCSWGWQRGMIGDKDAREILLRQGIAFAGEDPGGISTIHGLSWWVLQESLRPLPEPRELIELQERGLISDRLFNFWWARTGARGQAWSGTREALKYRFSPGQVVEARNRLLIAGQKEFEKHLKGIGIVGSEELGLMNRLRWQMPPITDVIRFAVKEAFDEDVVKALGYDDDYPAQLEPYAQAVGVRLPSDASDDPAFKDASVSIPKLYWRSHWQPISPGQSYTMLHRIRRDGAYDLGGGKTVDLKKFTVDDVRRWLRVSDYPPAIRDYLAAISYRTLTRVDVRRMFDTGVLTKDEVKEAYLDAGYNDANAQRLADFTEQLKLKKDKGADTWVKAEKAKTRKAALDGYEAGALSRPVVRTVLENDGATGEDAEYILDGIELRLRVTLVRKAVQAIRRDFLSGALTAGEAQANLGVASVERERAEQLVRAWQAELNYPRRVASTKEVLEWLERGLIQWEAARQRLINLGWSDPDTFLWLSEVGQDLDKARLADQMRAARTEQQRAKAVEQAARRQRSEHEHLRSELERVSSPSRMKSWLKKGAIADETIRRRLRLIDWNEDDIERWFIEARNGQAPQATPEEEPA